MHKLEVLILVRPISLTFASSRALQNRISKHGAKPILPHLPHFRSDVEENKETGSWSCGDPLKIIVKKGRDQLLTLGKSVGKKDVLVL